VEETAAQFSTTGARRYRWLVEPMCRHFEALFSEALMPILRLPRRPLLLAGLGVRALPPASFVARFLADEKAAALFGGMAGHAIMSLDKLLSSAIAVMLSVAGHERGWPVAVGGSGAIARSLLKEFTSLGGVVEVGREVK